jgi:hypothetical protein
MATPVPGRRPRGSAENQMQPLKFMNIFDSAILESAKRELNCRNNPAEAANIITEHKRYAAEQALLDQKVRMTVPAWVVLMLEDASGCGDLDALERLIAVGAIELLRPETRFDPLNITIGFGWEEGTERLLAVGCQLDWTAGAVNSLHAAASAGWQSMVERLLSLGANANVVDGDGQTPLHHYARGPGDCPNRGVVTALMTAGATTTALDNDGRTPFVAALDCGHLRKAGCILEKSKAKPSRSVLTTYRRMLRDQTEFEEKSRALWSPAATAPRSGESGGTTL